MIKSEILKLLCCPQTRQNLALADGDMIVSLNKKILNGQLYSCIGEPVSVALTEGLIREDGKVLYPIRDGIPILVTAEAIDLSR